VKRSEPDGVRPATSKAVGGISTKQSGGEMPASAARLKKHNIGDGFILSALALTPPVKFSTLPAWQKRLLLKKPCRLHG